MGRKELFEMARKKLLTKEQFELLSRMPEKRLEALLNELMTDVFLLTEKEIKKLISAKTEEVFRERLNEVKERLSGEDFHLLERGLLYQMSKFFGHLDFRKEPSVLKKELLFLIDRIIAPALEMIIYYRESGLLSEKDFAPIREALMKLMQLKEPKGHFLEIL